MKTNLSIGISKFIFLFVVPLNILLIVTNSFFAFSTYRQTKISTESMVNYFLDDIDSRLSTISFFLIKNGTEDSAFQSIAYDYVGKDYALEKIHLYQNLNSKIDLCPEIAYLFMFHSENNEMVIVPSSEYVSHGSYQAKETLCEMLKNPEQFLNASWTLITLQDQQFLLRLFKCNNTYLGVCVPTDSMIQKLKNYSFSNTAVTIAPTGTFTDKNSILDFFLLRHFQITADSSTGDFSVFLSADIPVNELWLGRYFSERHNRHHFILDSKGGALNPWDKSTPRINSECLRHDLENSLSNLHTDYLDYYWVHVDDPAVPVGEILEIMNQFKKEGKIRYFGCSNWSAERIHEAMRYADDKKITGFTAHQTMKNVAYPNMPAVLYDGMTYISPELEQLHTNDQFPLFAYTAAARGYFSLADRADFQTSPLYRSCRELFDNNKSRERLTAIKKLAKETGWDLTQIVLAYIYQLPYPSVPVIGVQSLRDIVNCLIAMELPIPTDFFEKIISKEVHHE